MNPVETVETGDQDDRQQGLVVEEIRSGYTRNGDVIRYAEVKVYASPSELPEVQIEDV